DGLRLQVGRLCDEFERAARLFSAGVVALDPFVADPTALDQETFATIWEKLDAALTDVEVKWQSLHDRAKDEVYKLRLKALSLFEAGGAEGNLRKFVDDIREALNRSIDAAPADVNALVDRARSASDELVQRAD